MPIDEALPTMQDTQTVSQNSFQLDFVNPFSTENGDDIAYSVIVTTKRDDPTAKSEVLPFWGDMMKSEKTTFTYVAIEKCAELFTEGDACWRRDRVKRAAKTTTSTPTVTLTVGGDTTCDETSVGACNGMLSAKTTYYVKLRATTEDGTFADTPFSEGITTGRRVFLSTPVIPPITTGSCILSEVAKAEHSVSFYSKL